MKKILFALLLFAACQKPNPCPNNAEGITGVWKFEGLSETVVDFRADGSFWSGTWKDADSLQNFGTWQLIGCDTIQTVKIPYPPQYAVIKGDVTADHFTLVWEWGTEVLYFK